MNDESSFGEEEAIGVCLVGCINHFLLQLWAQLGQLVNILPLVGALRHAEWEIEFELGEDLSAEEVLFDQGQVRQWLVTVNIRELQVQFKVSQLEESSWELVLQDSHVHR